MGEERLYRGLQGRVYRGVCTGVEIMWCWCCRLAKDMGCRVVGIAGSDDKCELLKEDLGVDETVNYK